MKLSLERYIVKLSVTRYGVVPERYIVKLSVTLCGVVPECYIVKLSVTLCVLVSESVRSCPREGLELSKRVCLDISVLFGEILWSISQKACRVVPGCVSLNFR